MLTSIYVMPKYTRRFLSFGKWVHSYLKGGGAVQFGDVNCVWRHVGDVGDELFQAVAGQLKVRRVNDNLNQLDKSDTVPCFISS